MTTARIARAPVPEEPQCDGRITVEEVSKQRDHLLHLSHSRSSANTLMSEMRWPDTVFLGQEHLDRPVLELKGCGCGSRLRANDAAIGFQRLLPAGCERPTAVRFEVSSKSSTGRSSGMAGQGLAGVWQERGLE